MKKVLSIILVLMLTISMAACGGKSAPQQAAAPAASTPAPAASAPASSSNPSSSAPAAETRVLRFNVMLGVGSNGDIFAQEWSKLVKERTNGSVQIDVYAGSQLGAGTEQFESVELGAIDIGWADSSQMYAYDNHLDIISLPFTVGGFKEMESVYDGYLGDGITQNLIDNGNMRWLGKWWIGPRNFSTKVLLTGLDAAKGIKCRCPESAIYIETVKSLGMNPTPIAWTEVYTSLESGIVDAQACNLENIYIQQFYKICPYIWLSNHIWQVGGPIMNEDVFQSFPADIQQILIDTAKEVSVTQRAAYEADEQEYIEKIKADGGTVSPLETFKDLDTVYDTLRNGYWLDVAKKDGLVDYMNEVLDFLGK